MTAREIEAALLNRCTVAAREAAPTAQDQREANIFQLAAVLIRSRFPRESNILLKASEQYFETHHPRFAPHVRFSLHDERRQYSSFATRARACKFDHDHALFALVTRPLAGSGEAQSIIGVDTSLTKKRFATNLIAANPYAEW